MGSEESRFNVSFIVKDKVTRQCPQTTTFDEKGEPKRIRTEDTLLQYQPNALPLGQTGSAAQSRDTITAGYLWWTFKYIPCIYSGAYQAVRVTVGSDLGLCCHFVFVRLSSA